MATSRRAARGWLRGNGKNRVTLTANSALTSSHTDRSIGTCLGVKASGHIDGPPPGHLWPIIYASGRTLYRDIRQAPTCARTKYVCFRSHAALRYSIRPHRRVLTWAPMAYCVCSRSHAGYQAHRRVPTWALMVYYACFRPHAALVAYVGDSFRNRVQCSFALASYLTFDI